MNSTRLIRLTTPTKGLLLRSTRLNSTKATAKYMEPAFGKPDLVAAKQFQDSLKATESHAGSTAGLWFKISMLVALPAILMTSYHVYKVEAEHARHRDHLKHVPDEDWPRDYEFMNIRSKPFFWGNGDQTAFWNPVVNRNINHDE
ncbi:cytochrome c oxidase subunit 13, mitochondrial [Monosporozyma servazzii]